MKAIFVFPSVFLQNPPPKQNRVTASADQYDHCLFLLPRHWSKWNYKKNRWKEKKKIKSTDDCSWVNCWQLLWWLLNWTWPSVSGCLCLYFHRRWL